MTEKLVLGAPFSDHMVLQRGRSNRIWGWDRAGQAIRIEIEGGGQRFSVSCESGADGSFRGALPVLPTGGPYTLRVIGSVTRVLEDVLVGEVWLASGQSNMEWTVAQSDGTDQAVARATSRRIRCLRMPRVASREELRSSDAAWSVMTSDAVLFVSAVGYYFARELEQKLDVPVGFIDAAWGGTRVEAWTSERALGPLLDLGAERARYYLPPAEHAQVTAEYQQRLSAWENQQLPSDPGNAGLAQGFADSGCDDREWRTMRLPSSWQAAGMRFNGVVWFRRELDLPASFAENDLWLSLGAIDDFDHTYVNGEQVGAHPKGTPGAFQIQRRYRVPARLLRAGKNVIAVRVFDHFGEGGFMGPAQAMYAESEPGRGERIPLDGDWRCQVEHEIPLVPGTVFASYPVPPESLSPQNAPAGLFNGMIAPLLPYGLAGALFYQGESNVDQHASYARRFRALVRDFRERFSQGQLPFLFVQLASFQASPEWPLLREAQAEVLSEPETGMVCTLDIGDRGDIHPRNKLDVGRRLARLALAHSYGQRDVVATGPSLERIVISGAECRVFWRDAAGLSTSDGAAPRGFELCADDGVFHAANASIEAHAVLLTCASVKEPVAARYAFADYVDVNLVNAALLPAFPFRTDCR